VNDSEEPVIYALDATGVVTGRVRVTGATVEDWEAIAGGPAGAARASMSATSATTMARANRSRSIAFRNRRSATT
jgi:phage tail tape-measure protein